MPVFTEVLPIDNASGASFQLPNTEDVKVMAVRVTVDNSGGTATQPELALLAPTGAVIATERQSEAIPAGDSGMASWALRLAKKASGGGGTAAREQFQSNTPATILSLNSDYLDWDYIDGASLLDLTVPKFPTVKAAGVYAITTTVGVSPMTAGKRYYHQLSAGTPGFPMVVQSSGEAVAADPQPWVSCSMTSQFRANEPLFAYVYNFDSVSRDFYILRAIVQKVS